MLRDIEKIRLNINDRHMEIFDDMELEDFLEEENGNINGATAKAFEVMAAAPDGLTKTYARGDVQISKTTMLELAQYYREKQKIEIEREKENAAKENRNVFFFIARSNPGGDANV